MKEGPAIAAVAALIGDPARTNMLQALMATAALTASELAREAGVTPQTASGHLGKLQAGGLLSVEHQGRHRYYRLAGPDVAAALEALMGIAGRVRPQRTRPGPKDDVLRTARACYDHLAGGLGVSLYDHFLAGGRLAKRNDELVVTESGRRFFCDFGLDMAALENRRRPLCRACLDWSERRAHLAGSLGAALLGAMLARGWCARPKDSRALAFSLDGRVAFERFCADAGDGDRIADKVPSVGRIGVA
jgi:DNA-binding transcriptional ArsR family regulator